MKRRNERDKRSKISPLTYNGFFPLVIMKSVREFISIVILEMVRTNDTKNCDTKHCKTEFQLESMPHISSPP